MRIIQPFVFLSVFLLDTRFVLCEKNKYCIMYKASFSRIVYTFVVLFLPLPYPFCRPYPSPIKK